MQEQKTKPEDIKSIAQLEAEVEKIFLMEDKGVTKIVCATIIANRMNLDPVWLLLIAPSSGGKCLGRGTKVLMHNGSIKKVEDIKRGEKVMGNDSTPRKVLTTTTGKEMMYKIVPTHGATYKVNESHILSLIYNNSAKEFNGFKKGDILNITVREFLSKSKYFQKQFKGYRVGIDFPYKKVKLDPYFLGVWLGDGNNYYPSICTPDKEIVDYLYYFAKKHNLKITLDEQKNHCPSYLITTGIRNRMIKNFVKEEFRKYDLFQNKHIPEIYKINSEKNRLELLAGLLDTDGYLSENRRFEIITKYKNLADDIVFLSRSLGFATSINKKIGTIKRLNFRGEYYRINISGAIWKIPTKIKRKQAAKRSLHRNFLSYGITIKKLKVDNYYGFKLDGNKLFCLADFTVTHNTEFISAISGLEFVFPISDLTPNTFASGQKKAGKETSLLLKMNNGIMAFKDFTSLLSKNKDAKKEIMGQLREIYDGEYVKRVGTGDDIMWRGKIGAIAGSTEAVYRHLEEMSAMGDRFVMYNIKQPDRLAVARRAMDNSFNMQEKRDYLRKCFEAYITYVIKNLDEEQVILDEKLKDDMLVVADFATRVRSAVMTDFKTGLVDFVPSAEMPMRVTSQLITIASALASMRRVDPTQAQGKHAIISDEEKKLLYKIAFDSIPRTRRDALYPMAQYKGGITTAGLATRLDLPTPSVSKYLAQLNALGICKRKKKSGGQGDEWHLKDEYRKILVELENIKILDEQLIGEVSEDDSPEGSWRNTEKEFDDYVADPMDLFPD